ncbi:MAG: energy-coupling factor transporter transmembrane protein EcfT [Gammaproteobacteria bacterium]|nr:energy-coupling factor transporter transmembrane protein EcfT [Gammaproteobacteria bacterium]
MISLYLSERGWLHEVPAGSKLLFLCVSSILLLPLESLVPVLMFLLTVLALYVSMGRAAVEQLKMLSPLLPFLFAIFALHMLTGSSYAGAVAITRLLAMVLLANLVSMTTRMADMMAAMRPVFAPLAYLGLSTRRITLAVALMIRFAPVLFALFDSLNEAWRARSIQRPRLRLLAPFTIQALKLTDKVGEALQARGGAAGLTDK